MARIGSIAWHEQKIEELRDKKREQNDRAEAKRKGVKSYNNHKVSVDTPKTKYRSRVEYDFLKYIRIIFKWTLDNYDDLTRPEVELLLYLYGTGAFSKKMFNDFHKTLGIFSIKTLNKFIDNGYIKLWRPQKGRQHALYTLTHKAKIMCNKMHKFAIGEDKIPEKGVNNKMLRKDAPRVNNYYLDIIKRMNKDRGDEEE